jgi:hypothetical protein
LKLYKKPRPYVPHIRLYFLTNLFYVVLLHMGLPFIGKATNSSSVELGQPPFPYTYDDYPYFAREKVLELSNKYYNRLVKGITDCSISTAAAIGTN